MKGKFWLLFFVLGYTLGLSQEHTIPEGVNDEKQLKTAYLNAIDSKDTIAIFDAANALARYFNSQAQFDSLYHYQEILIEYFDGIHGIDQYIEAVKNNYFMDRRFGRGNLANTRVDQILSWMDDGRVSMKNRSDIAFLVAGYHHGNGQIDSMLDYQLKSIVYADSILESNRLQVVTRAQMGLYLEDVGRYAEALDFLTEAEPLMDQLVYPAILQVQLYEAIAKAMVKVNDVKTAEQYADKLIQIFRSNEFTTMDHRIAQIKGHIAREKGDYKDALDNYLQASNLASKKARSKPSKIFNQINAAFMHLRLDDPSGAKPLLDSISIVTDLNDRAQVLLNILWADYYIRTNNLTRASAFLQKVNAFNNIVNPHEKTIAELNRRYHQAAGNTEQEITFLRQHNRIKDSLDEIANKAVARRLEAEFNREKQAIEITALTQTNVEKDKSLAIRNTLIWVGGISLLILGSLLFGLYRLYLKNQENQRQLSVQNKQISETLATNQLLMKEIHHRVKNNLQVVSSLLSMQARKSVDPTTRDALQSSKSRVQSMSILHKSLYKDDSPTEVDVHTYFTEIIENIKDTYQGEKPIRFDTQIEHIKLDVDVLVPLGLIVNELVTNAYKHAFESKESGIIDIGFTYDKKEDTYTLKVIDDGIGINENEFSSKESSLGNKLIKEFTRRLNGTLTINSEKEGTSILITFGAEDLYGNPPE